MNTLHFERANFRGSRLEQASLKNAYFEGACLDEAHLEGAGLDEVHLQYARMDGAHLEGAYLLSATGLTQDQLDQAFGDEATVLPKGLTRPENERWPGASPPE